MEKQQNDHHRPPFFHTFIGLIMINLDQTVMDRDSIDPTGSLILVNLREV